MVCARLAHTLPLTAARLAFCARLVPTTVVSMRLHVLLARWALFRTRRVLTSAFPVVLALTLVLQVGCFVFVLCLFCFVLFICLFVVDCVDACVWLQDLWLALRVQRATHWTLRVLGILRCRVVLAMRDGTLVLRVSRHVWDARLGHILPMLAVRHALLAPLDLTMARRMPRRVLRAHWAHLRIRQV